MAQINPSIALQAQGTDVLSPFLGLQQNRRQNQLIDLQKRQFDAEQQQLAQQEAQRQQFNQLIPQLLGLSPAEAQIAGDAGMPEPGAPDRNALLAQGFALDPQRTQQILALQQQQQAAEQAAAIEAAKKDFNEAAYVLKSAAPLRLMREAFPDDYAQLVQLAQAEGLEESEITDEHALEIARRVQAHTGSIAGIGPAGDGEQFTLGEGQTRFDAQGNPIASVAPDESDKDPTDKAFTRADKLRDEFTAQTKDFETISSAYQNILSSAGDSSGASDISLVYGFMKFQDPNSTVREGEYATAENAGGVSDRFRSLYNKAIDGQFLTPRVRADFVAQAGKLYAGQTERYEQKRKRYSDLATRAGVSPIDVVGEPSTVKPAASPANGGLGIGQTVDVGGFRVTRKK
jgi:hypothetical protein